LLNIIHRFYLDIDISSQKDSVVQQRFCDLLYTCLLGELSKLFCRVSVTFKNNLCIERLVVDVGDVPMSQFETVFTQRLLTQLEEQLVALLAAAPTAAAGEPLSSQQGITAAHFQEKSGLQLHSSLLNPVYKEGAIHQPTADAALSVVQEKFGLAPLFHYLKWGYLAFPHQALMAEWNTSDGTDNWLCSHLAASSAEQRQMLAHYCLQSVPRQRLLQTFSTASLQAICSLLLDDKLELTPPADKPALELCLLLSSLWVFRQPSAGVLPAPPPLVVDSNLLPELAPWLLVLFGHSPLLAASLPWLQPFWQQPVVQQLLASELIEPDFTRLQQRMGDVTPQSEVEKRKPQATALEWRKEDRLGPSVDGREYTETSVTGKSPTQLPTGSNAPLSEQEPLSVPNAGLVLLWPLLPGLLRQLGLLEEQQFSSPQAQLEAVCWLDGLIWGDEAMAEWRTPLGKLLCGLPLESLLVPWSSPEPEVNEQMLEWLAAIPAQLPGLHRCSANDLRSLFLQRPGQLIQTQSGWQLSVEADASDFLLSQLPWALDFFRFPWMEKPLQVKWLSAVT
jgi:hypothetical protein